MINSCGSPVSSKSSRSQLFSFSVETRGMPLGHEACLDFSCLGCALCSSRGPGSFWIRDMGHFLRGMGYVWTYFLYFFRFSLIFASFVHLVYVLSSK
ncbi:hypothetical protein Hanom_Chr17g01555511 [Helianthus anomalus]